MDPVLAEVQSEVEDDAPTVNADVEAETDGAHSMGIYAHCSKVMKKVTKGVHTGKDVVHFRCKYCSKLFQGP